MTAYEEQVIREMFESFTEEMDEVVELAKRTLRESSLAMCETIRSATQELREKRLGRGRADVGTIERKYSPGLLEVKRAGGLQAGRFSGYASKFLDRHETSSWSLGSGWSDLMAPGAFTATLAEHRARDTKPAMLLQHDMSGLPVGAWREVRQDQLGLYVEGELALATPKGAEVFSLMKMGAMDGLSIGFKVTKFKLDERARLRTIQEVDLFEISPVTIPADPGARVHDVGGK